ncbi:hypothetical protein D9M68_635160 [compost metagenome]
MHRGRGNAAPVEPVVLIEAVVLGRDQRRHHVGRDLLERHPVAVGPLEDRQLLAVGRQHLRRLLGLGFADVADARRERHQHQHVQQHGRRHGGHARQHAAARGAQRAGPGQAEARAARAQAGQALLDRGGERSLQRG